MKQQTPLHQLLELEVSRKEFLATLGFGVLSVIGLSSILKFLTGHSGSTVGMKSIDRPRGYGSSAYGE